MTASLPPGPLQAAADRQLPGPASLAVRASPPQEDSRRAFHFSVKTGVWNEVMPGHDPNHAIVMRCFWHGVNTTARHKPNFPKRTSPTCWGSLLSHSPNPSHFQELAQPRARGCSPQPWALANHCSEFLISLSASKWPTA